MNSPNEEQERMKERIANACIDALQRYPDMPDALRQYMAEYLLCGIAGRLPEVPLASYRWLLPLHPNSYTASKGHVLDLFGWDRALTRYAQESGYKETIHED